MTHLLCIGEAMAELRFTADGPALGYGGDTFNTAIYAARALGGDVAYLTRIGSDPLSDGLLEVAGRAGLFTSGFIRDPERNIGLYAVTTDAAGERSFHYWRSASAARQLFTDAEDLDLIGTPEIVYLSGITLAVLSPTGRANLRTQLLEVRANGGLVAFDSNYRPGLWESTDAARAEIGALWSITDIALPSLDDEIALYGGGEAETVARLAAAGCTSGALKRGAMGPLPLTGIAAGPFPPAARVIDTTAAGDSFNAAYLAARLKGRSEADCLAAGHELAARVVMHPGALI